MRLLNNLKKLIPLLILVILTTVVLASTVSDLIGEGETLYYTLDGTNYQITNAITHISYPDPEYAYFEINGFMNGPIYEGDFIVLNNGVKFTINDIYYDTWGGPGGADIVNFTLESCDRPNCKFVGNFEVNSRGNNVGFIPPQ